MSKQPQITASSIFRLLVQAQCYCVRLKELFFMKFLNKSSNVR